jgi:hypothetical protein
MTGITPDNKPQHKRLPRSLESRQKQSEQMRGKINSGSFKPKIIWPKDQELLAMVNTNGLSTTAKTLGINPSSLSERLDKHGLKHNRPRTITSERMTPERALALVALHKSGNYTTKELAEQFHTSTHIVSGILAGRSHSKITGIKPTNNKVSKDNTED